MSLHTSAFLRRLFQGGDIIELRGLSGGKVYSGRFNDTTGMSRNAAALQQKYTDSVYFTINPIKPDATHIGDKALNKVARTTRRTAGDRDIARRANYVIDVDSVRPKGVCATKAERHEAMQVSTQVQAYLTERGWPLPIVVDSGNGFHLYYRADGGDPNNAVWPFVLRHLASLFTTPGATVDTAVSNAARIMRLPGTYNRKGPGTADRPHRLCRVILTPDDYIPVSNPTVYRLAVEGGYEGTSRKTVQRDGNRPELVDEPGEAIAAFIAEYPEHLEVAHVYERNGNTYWALKTCPFVGRAHRGSALKTAIRLTDTSVGFCCWSDECAGKGMRDLKELLYEQTGRRSQVRFYGPRDEQAGEEMWFNWEMEEYWVRMESAVRFRPDVMYDQETYRLLPQATTMTDPAVYGLEYDTLAEPFRAWSLNNVRDMDDAEARAFTARCATAHAAQDAQAIADITGPAELWHLYRGITRPVEAGPAWWANQGDTVLNTQQMRHALAEYTA